LILDARVLRVLAVLAIEPRIGGLCIRGGLGSGKSRALEHAVACLSVLLQRDHRKIFLPRTISLQALASSIDLSASLLTRELVTRAGLVDQAAAGILAIDDLDRFDRRTLAAIKGAVLASESPPICCGTLSSSEGNHGGWRW
jgi:Mg-chelatase subunit ChlI